MKSRILLCLSVVVALLVSGCSTFTPPTRTHELEPGKSYVIDYDASRRGTYMVPVDSGVRICAEPAPDVAMESITRIIAELKLAEPNVDAKTQVELQTKVVELAGRTQLVLVLRESLYRLCEQYVNGGLTGEQVEALYNKVLDTIVLLAQADLVKEHKEIIERLDDPVLKEIFEGIISNQ